MYLAPIKITLDLAGYPINGVVALSTCLLSVRHHECFASDLYRALLNEVLYKMWHNSANRQTYTLSHAYALLHFINEARFTDKEYAYWVHEYILGKINDAERWHRMRQSGMKPPPRKQGKKK
jgi:hypothetical protein